MKEFYKDHTNDPDTKGKVILDPFMGGGTTIVEALRLGCKVIGIDLNPVAWFIVKTEVEPVDLQELQKAFDRLAARPVNWSGKPLKETLLNLYKTTCPACGNADADIIYTFWVKLAPCTTGTCTHETPLFSDYIVAQKKPSIRYFPDCECPQCGKTFDWEKDSAALVGDTRLMINAGKFSAGEGRTNVRWAYSHGRMVRCPWCDHEVAPVPKKPKPIRKKVPLSVLLCPHCEEIWQFRGELPDDVECPSCKQSYKPNEGNLVGTGKFVCRGTCNGNVDAVISAIRRLPGNQLLRTQAYGIEGWCSCCAGGSEPDEDDEQEEMFDGNGGKAKKKARRQRPDPDAPVSILFKNSGKFFKRVSAADVASYQKASELWQANRTDLPHPKSEVPVGEKTKSGLLAHHYRHWHQMFNDRQLLALSTLLRGIDQEESRVPREFLLLAMSHCLETNNVFTRTLGRRKTPGGIAPGGIFSRHDFQPKSTFSEQNVYGEMSGRKTFSNAWALVIDGKEFNQRPFDRKIDELGTQVDVPSNEVIAPAPGGVKLFAKSSTQMELSESADCVVTDPPYVGNVNYSELADFFYVWLRLILKASYPQFVPEYVPKSEEVIENSTRGKSSEDFKMGLTAVFRQARVNSNAEAPLIFTFHHAEDAAWEALLSAVCDAGYFIEAVFPVHGEAENSLHLMDNEAISYDLIHVCRQRESPDVRTRSWASIRQEIRRRAREEAVAIQSGRYGNEPLTPADINILLIGKCLELYSKHYGAVVDFEDKPVPLRKALEEIKMLVDQLVAKEQPLPTELEDIDIPSYIYFRALSGIREIKGDEVNKYTRGLIEVAELKNAGLIIRGREKRGRSFEVKQPSERLNELKERFKIEEDGPQPELFEGGERKYAADIPFVDYVHLLLGLAENGESVLPWLERFRGLRPQIRAALEFLAQRNKNFADSSRKILGLIDERTLFTVQQQQ
jgi:adenine-specific DNA methylase